MFGRHRPWGLPPSRLALPLPMAHYPGGAMVGGQASRLAPHRHATRAHCLSGLTACPWRLATASKTAATIGMIAAVRTETSVRCPYK